MSRPCGPLLTLLLLAFLGGALHAQIARQKNGEVVFTGAGDPLHVCDSRELEILPPPLTRPSKIHQENVASYSNQIRDLFAEIENKHRSMLTYLPDWENRNLIVLKDTAQEPVGPGMRNEWKVARVRYGDDKKLACIIVDSRRQSNQSPHRSVRRIARLSFEGEDLTAEFETLQERQRYGSRFTDLEPALQLRALRRMREDLRSMAYALDIMLSRLEEENRRRRRSTQED